MSRKAWFLLVIIFAFHLFFRFYQLEGRSPFGWDQVDSAWAAKGIIVDHKWPLIGTQAKLNSGIFVGPLYYYLVAFVYWLANLDPIASGIFAGMNSIFTFVIIFFLTRKIFSARTALVAVFLHTFSFSIIGLDRIQWTVNWIVPTSLIIFFALNRVLLGQVKYLVLLSIAVGLSFRSHFTAVFYPLIIFLSLPFFPKRKETLKYALLALLLFLLFLLPNLVYELKSHGSSSRSLVDYLATYYHGFHLVRIFQLTKDAFIEFESFFNGILKPIKYILCPIFVLVYLRGGISKGKLIFVYLTGLWFLIPWLVFSVYSGEISNYYFSLTRPIVIMIVAYLIAEIFKLRFVWLNGLLIVLGLYFAVINLQIFWRTDYDNGLVVQRREVVDKIRRGETVEFRQGAAESYLYYFYTHKKWKEQNTSDEEIN